VLAGSHLPIRFSKLANTPHLPMHLPFALAFKWAKFSLGHLPIRFSEMAIGECTGECKEEKKKVL